ncbi:ABC transporter substrate-binding protein [uncultured Microbacterium sp.]|uniref:ABC transporter substrate-binding protein n=1 Tax=uncultured Microbacterium sp. TaxID=191216 RepID=UPI0025F50C1F|nr:ABC transporter substrate-binding protein [uncultured Microbacterium sp.]
MNRSTTRRGARLAALTASVVAGALLFAGCSSSDPLGASGGASAASDGPIVIGSQAYDSNEIVAEIYAQALEAKGFTVTRQFSIGQREAYVPTLESGAITLFPEYSGDLLQFLDKATTARSADDVYAALQKALPANLEALDQSTASDQNSYTVTKAFADQYGLTSIEDLSKVSVPLTLGGPAELAERPYGPNGLKSTYDISIGFQATGDTTLDALLAGTVNVANIYTANPAIQTDNLVVLKDPKALFLASNVVPIVQKDRADEIAPVINPISAKLTPEGLVALNVKSQVDKQSPAVIAKAWLAENGF